MADFPKKQQQCLIPKYLLDYTRELNQNHPDPSDPWGGGGGGSPIEAGTGIEITGDETKTISIDTEVVPVKTDLSTVAFSGDYTDLQNKPTIPTKTSDLDNDSGFLTDTDLDGYVKAGITMSDVYRNTLNLDYTGVRFSNTETSSPYASYDTLSVHIVRPRTLYEYAKSVSLSPDELYMEYQYSDYDTRYFRVNMAAGEFTTGGLSNYFGNTRITNLGLDTYGQSASINIYDGNMYNCTYYLRKDFNGTIATLADLPDLTDYVTSSQLSTTLSDYALSNDVTSLASLVSSNTSRISALESGISDCVTLSQLSTTLADYALSSTVTSLASLVSSNTSAISDLTSQVGNCVTLSQLSTTLADYATVSSLSSYATISTLSDYATISSLSSYATVSALSNYAQISTLASVATTGNYNDLTNKPTIPSVVANPATTTQTLSAISIDGVGYSIPSGGGGATYTLSTSSASFVNSATLSKTSETLIFTYSDNTTASFTFLTASTSLSTTTNSALTSATLNES